MNVEGNQEQPSCFPTTRLVHIGGWSKSKLLEELRRQDIRLNPASEELFASDRFATSESRYSVSIVELTVRDLGLPLGGTFAEICARANQRGLATCPLELGPHLRLQYLDQPEGCTGADAKNQAPHGSMTVASEALSDDDDFPKGFYLRRINGTLWLRGYRCDAQHAWNPEDLFVFVRRRETAAGFEQQ